MLASLLYSLYMKSFQKPIFNGTSTFIISAPDPEEDPEAQKAMEHLATLAAQVYTVISSGNVVNNATRAVLNQTKQFFQSGVMPQAGLDELDDFLLKKIGMLSHCGFDNEMQVLFA